MVNEELLNPNAVGNKGITNSDRFWKFVHVCEEPECWEWRGSHCGRYGRFKLTLDGTSINVQAHRYSYYLKHGYFPTSKEYICHKCDNTYCVNPEHLFLGSQTDNMQDMIKKGRGGNFSGENNPNRKLDRAQVKKFFEEREKFGFSGDILAERFNISKTQSYRILRGESWNGSH